MLTVDKLLSYEKDELEKISKSIRGDELSQLVEWLSEKDDSIRYQALLLLQYRSLNYDDVYPYMDVFAGKLKSDNSYQRSIGAMLIAYNARWDKEKKLDGIIDGYLQLLNDVKPITVRQCIQKLSMIVPYKLDLQLKIAQKLMALNIMEVKETMRKLILLDILNVLAAIKKYRTTDEIDSYILNAISGGLLDKKSIKQLESML